MLLTYLRECLDLDASHPASERLLAIDCGNFRPALMAARSCVLEWCEMGGVAFWSASSVSFTTNLAWLVYLAYGNTNNNNKTNGYFVACVR